MSVKGIEINWPSGELVEPPIRNLKVPGPNPDDGIKKRLNSGKIKPSAPSNGQLRAWH